jgi:hypothetical protein
MNGFLEIFQIHEMTNTIFILNNTQQFGQWMFIPLGLGKQNLKNILVKEKRYFIHSDYSIMFVSLKIWFP